MRTNMSEIYRRIFTNIIAADPNATYSSRNEFLKSARGPIMTEILQRNQPMEDDALDHDVQTDDDSADDNIPSTARHHLRQFIIDGYIHESKTKNGIRFSINNAHKHIILENQPLLAAMSSLTYYAYPPINEDTNSIGVVLSAAMSDPLCSLLNQKYNEKNIFFQPAGPTAFTCTRFLTKGADKENTPSLAEHLHKILGGIQLFENSDLKNTIYQHTYEDIYSGAKFYYSNGTWIPLE